MDNLIVLKERIAEFITLYNRADHAASAEFF